MPIAKNIKVVMYCFFMYESKSSNQVLDKTNNKYRAAVDSQLLYYKGSCKIIPVSISTVRQLLLQ